GNFGGSSNWVHILKEKSKTDDNYAYFKINAWDAVESGILKKDEVEQAKKDLPAKVFKQLYLAEETENKDQLISNENIRNLWTNDFGQTGERYITADIALHGSDRFILFVWEGWKVIGFKQINKADANDIENTIKE